MNDAEVAAGIAVIAGHHKALLASGFFEKGVVILLHIGGKHPCFRHIVALCPECFGQFGWDHHVTQQAGEQRFIASRGLAHVGADSC
jgi:hypothetical protein